MTMGRKLGQHFLKDGKVLAAIARETLVASKSPVIEIGPGHGELTESLIAAGAEKIVAIEKDPSLAILLREKYAARPSVTIVEGDVRKILPELVATTGSVITGNIPYYLTGYLLRRLGELITDDPKLITKVVLLVQKEVAERACATAPRTNLLSAVIHGFAEPKIALTVPRGAFAPPPKVDSALLVLVPHTNMATEKFARYVRAAKTLFAHPRKTVTNNLRDLLGTERTQALLAETGIKENARPAELSPAEIEKIGDGILKLT